MRRFVRLSIPALTAVLAAAFAGGCVPPHGPSVAAWIFQTAFENERAGGTLQDFEKLLEAEKAAHRSALFPNDSLARQLDDLIYELTFKDEQPDGLGTLSLDAAGPFPVDSLQTIEQTYTVGSAPLRKGAAFYRSTTRPATATLRFARPTRTSASRKRTPPWTDCRAGATA